jgi:dTDP-4-amino-4,6-dideoxygalactose transaminase
VTTRTDFIPILDLKPQYESLKDGLREAITQVVESGQFIMGSDVEAFEAEVAEYLGVKHTIAVNSGTDALFIGLRALDIRPGDEVITTPFTFFATAEAISHVGATPVFADVDERTFNINPELIEEKITERTRAILPVHLFGRPAEMDRIMKLAEKHDLKVVEDCAQSFGARHGGRQTGTIGSVGAYSFFPSKNLGAYGDGGLIVTNDDALADTARMLRVHGAKKKYHNEVVGYNSRLDSIQAAILRVKLPYVDVWNEGRCRVARLYSELLQDVPGVTAPELVEGHVFHQYTVSITQSNRDEVQARLKEAGIGTMVYYPVPQDRLPLYKGRYPANPVSDKLAGQVLSLPIWPELEPNKQRYIVRAMAVALGLSSGKVGRSDTVPCGTT